VGYFYKNILDWMKRAAAEIPAEDRLEWMYLVRDAVRDVLDKLEQEAGYVYVEEPAIVAASEEWGG